MHATVMNRARRSFAPPSSPSVWRKPAGTIREILGQALIEAGRLGEGPAGAGHGRESPQVVVLLVAGEGFCTLQEFVSPSELERKTGEGHGEGPFGSGELRRQYGLTPREVEVVRLLADRLSSREIASRLGISLNTARRHSENVLRKLGVRSRHEIRDVLRGQRPACRPWGQGGGNP